MKTPLIIILAILASCSTAWHYGKIESKDPNFWSQFNDTIQIPFKTYDTIFHEGDTIAIIERIEYRDTIIQTRTINPKSRYDYKSESLQLRHALKMEKERTKQLANENRLLKAKSRHENRTEQKINDDFYKFLEALSKQKTKQVKAENNNGKWLMFLIGLVVGSIFGMAFMFKHRTNVLRWLRGF
jgi:hypothetical protein